MNSLKTKVVAKENLERVIWNPQVKFFFSTSLLPEVGCMILVSIIILLFYLFCFPMNRIRQVIRQNSFLEIHVRFTKLLYESLSVHGSLFSGWKFKKLEVFDTKSNFLILTFLRHNVARPLIFLWGLFHVEPQKHREQRHLAAK